MSDTDKRCRIGIDLGGTKIEGILLDEHHHELARKRVNTEQHLGYSHIMDKLAELYAFLQNAAHGVPTQVGIGTPGYSNKEGLIKNSSLQVLNDRPFIKDFEKRAGVLPKVENDANCFAVAEAILGGGKGCEVVFGVIMGTGCGGGVVIGGKVIRGAQYIGGEVGHAILYPGGVDCFCGKKGCVERYISGSGVQERHQERTGVAANLKTIVEDYRKGSQEAKVTMDEFLDNFAMVMANLINVLDPDKIVIGGGVSNIDELYTDGISRVSHYVFKENPDIHIVKNQLGDSAGVFGAALL